MLSIYRYPSGEHLKELSGVEAEHAMMERSLVKPESPLACDLDGDGIADLVETGTTAEYGVSRVRSGADGRVLFENVDDLEYESSDRAVCLGDLDGDGRSEIALIHPRMDRSRYDFELWDLLFGAKSWITVVSGGRLRS
jgi:hypothetical protein